MSNALTAVSHEKSIYILPIAADNPFAACLSVCCGLHACSVRTFASAAEPAFAIPDTRPKLQKDTGINVARYVQENYTAYGGDSSFLKGPTARTQALWAELEKLCCVELEKGIMGVDPHVPSTITAFPAGYIDKDKEVVVGLQTDEPLKRAIKPLGGINMVRAALEVGNAQEQPLQLLLLLLPLVVDSSNVCLDACTTTAGWRGDPAYTNLDSYQSACLF